MDALINADYPNIKSVREYSAADISTKLGVDMYVARIILEEAKRVLAEMTRTTKVIDDSTLIASQSWI